MATLKTFQDLLAAVDAETTRIANKIQALLDQITAGGMSAADEDAVQAALQAEVDRLKTIGADPTNPIPPPPTP